MAPDIPFPVSESLPADIHIEGPPGHPRLYEIAIPSKGVLDPLKQSEKYRLNKLHHIIHQMIAGISMNPWPLAGRFEQSPLFRAARALKIQHLTVGHSFLDLGSGRGRVVFLTASLFGTHSVGLELKPEDLNSSQISQNALKRKKLIRKGATELFSSDYRKVSWGKYDYLFYTSYGSYGNVSEIMQKAMAEMKPGAMLIVLGIPNDLRRSFDYEDLRPLIQSPEFGFKHNALFGVWSFTRKRTLLKASSPAAPAQKVKLVERAA
jgi:hypothetical protein